MGEMLRRRRRKRRRRVRWGRLALVLLGFAMAVFGLVKLIGYGVNLISSRHTSQSLRDVYYAAPTESSLPAAFLPTETPAPEMPDTPVPMPVATPAPTPAVTSTATVVPTQSPIPRLPNADYPNNPKLTISNRFKALRKECKYIVGWLYIDKMLDDVVVQRDNVFYLDHDVMGQSNVNGALFLDSGISLKTRPYTYIIYGHNMKSGLMFGFLRNYENSTFYHNDPFITFDTIYETGRYVVFAAGSISTEAWSRNYVDLYALRSTYLQKREEAMNALLAASVHTCTIDVRLDDQLLVLVTCVKNDEERRVVVARRVRDGENEADLKKLVEKSRKK